MTIETELPAVKVENERLRHIVSDCAAALVSGAFISPKASVEFMEGLPKEISLVVSGLRSSIEEVEKAVAYESGDPDAINGHRALFKRLHAAESRCEELVKALERSMVAINDWLHVYAPDECREADVAESRARLRENGTLWYIANVQEQNRDAIDSHRKSSAALKELGKGDGR